MQDKEKVIEQIRAAFGETEHPGDAFLQGSQEGCEPSEVTAPFKGDIRWTEVDSAVLDPNYTALSFFSEGGFRHFLPAFLIADLQGRLQTADPVFHLTNGFSDRVVNIPAGQRVHEKILGRSAFVNPRRYGAMTWHDHARCHLSVFTREEARAIVAYLAYRRDSDPHGLNSEEINAALENFWRSRAQEAPTRESIRQQMQAEAEYIKDIGEQGKG